MSRYLIVAHETAMNPDLIERVKALAADDPAAQFVLLVPATPVQFLLRRREGDAETLARKRAEEAKRAFAKAGLQLETRIGAP